MANANGATVRADINAQLQALASTSKGASRPSTPYTGQLWLEDDNPSSTVWTLYLYDGAQDIPLLHIDTTNNIAVPAAQAVQAVSTSTGTMNIGAAYSPVVSSSSTSTVTSLGTAAAGTIRTVYHSAAQQYTYNATSLITQNGANFTTVAGDFVTWLSLGSGNWRMMGVYRSTLSAGTVTSVSAGAGLSGGTITTTGTLTVNTNNSVGIGAYAWLANQSGSSVTNGSTLTTNGSNASYVKGNGSNQLATNGSVATGQVWRNISGGTIANGEFGFFIRVS